MQGVNFAHYNNFSSNSLVIIAHIASVKARDHASCDTMYFITIKCNFKVEHNY